MRVAYITIHRLFLQGILQIQGHSKSLLNVRPLRYSSRDGHAEGEHVNRGTDTPSFCPTLQAAEFVSSGGGY
jgi:hypothetical protein